MIAECDIPNASPDELIEQYKRFIYKLAIKYKPILERSGAIAIEDLHQVGFIALCEAQKTYEPGQGSFLHWLAWYAKKAMRKAVGINPNTGAAPERLVYLDEPLSEDTDTTLIETIQDPDAVTIDEQIIDDETCRETVNQVRAALERMKSEKQRTAVTLVWIDGKSRQAAADEMEMRHQSFCALENYGRCALRKDEQLRRFAMTEFPFYQVGARRFRSTWTSAVEKAVIWRDIHIFGNGDNGLNHDTNGGSECLVSETGRQ